jgi:hypothetical protein
VGVGLGDRDADADADPEADPKARCDGVPDEDPVGVGVSGLRLALGAGAEAVGLDTEGVEVSHTVSVHDGLIEVALGVALTTGAAERPRPPRACPTNQIASTRTNTTTTSTARRLQ